MDKYSDENVRTWAYDPNQNWIDDANQDEDLTLALLPIDLLLTMVDDPNCPKADYLLRCLDYHHMFIVLRGEDYRLAETREAADKASNCEQQKVKAWARLQNRRLAYRAGAGPVDREQALVMGQDLLNGIGRECQITISGESAGTWTVQLSVAPFHQHREWLTISKRTGQFEFSNYLDQPTQR